jgi:hypothetical protein
MCSYLLIGFWFTRPIAASACQKAFVTNCVGDFGLLLGILGFFFWITGSLEFWDLFKIVNNWISNNGINSLLLCVLFYYRGIRKDLTPKGKSDHVRTVIVKCDVAPLTCVYAEMGQCRLDFCY